MKPPKGIDPRGRALWRAVVRDLPDEWEFDARERALLCPAARLVPLAEGGADDGANLAPIHSDPCHRDKTAAEASRARS